MIAIVVAAARLNQQAAGPRTDKPEVVLINTPLQRVSDDVDAEAFNGYGGS
jgi:hypothetical protein